MKLIFLFLLGLAVLFCVYRAVVFYRTLQVSKVLIREAVAYQNQSHDRTKTLLVIGDSTGVGVGAAEPQESVAGLLAQGMHATYTENLAVSGAIVADLPGQIQQAKLAHYDTILMMVGANDVVAMHAVGPVALQVGTILDSLRGRAGRIIWMSAGDVGAATILPLPVRPLYSRLMQQYHAAFAQVGKAHGATYVNLYRTPQQEPFVQDPATYLAADSFHPSSAGYALWYGRLKEVLVP